jgi:sugar phosphate isomerase/epimerase
MTYTRRQIGKIAVAAIPVSTLLAKPSSRFNGVLIGVQSYSFRDRPLDAALDAITTVGFESVELWQGHVEPKRGTPPEEMKKWRTSPETLTQIKKIRQKFDNAGVKIQAFNYSFRANNTDEEVEQGMEMAKALGTKYITASSTVDQAKRLNDLAGKHGVLIAMHGHDNTENPNEYSTPESFAKAMDGNPNIRVNLDIGHFTAAGYDPVDYLNEHHDKIVCLHLKDRKKDHGPNMPFGEGETKIKEVLQVLRTKKYNIPANIEYEYKGADAVEEVRKCLEYCKQALA